MAAGSPWRRRVSPSRATTTTAAARAAPPTTRQRRCLGPVLREGEYGERAGIPWVVYDEGPRGRRPVPPPALCADARPHPTCRRRPRAPPRRRRRDARRPRVPQQVARRRRRRAGVADERRPSVDAALHARPLHTDEDAEFLAVLSEKCCAAIEANAAARAVGRQLLPGAPVAREEGIGRCCRRAQGDAADGRRRVAGRRADQPAEGELARE